MALAWLCSISLALPARPVSAQTNTPQSSNGDNYAAQRPSRSSGSLGPAHEQHPRPTHERVGIAVVAAGGTLYAVEDFAAGVPALSIEAVEQKVEEEIRALQSKQGTVQWVTLGVGREEARRACSEGKASGDGKVPTGRRLLK